MKNKNFENKNVQIAGSKTYKEIVKIVQSIRKDLEEKENIPYETPSGYILR